MRLRERIRRLESRFGGAILGPKRPLPEWLQETMESQGYVFDCFGHLISAPQTSENKPGLVIGAM